VTRKAIRHVLIPLLIGGFIYFSCRGETIYLNKFINTITSGLTGHLISRELNYDGLGWIIYCLPDGLWVYSFTSALLIIPRNKSTEKTSTWAFIPLLIGIFSEIGQQCQLIQGTFDFIDLFCIITASIIAIRNNKNNKTWIKNQIEATRPACLFVSYS